MSKITASISAIVIRTFTIGLGLAVFLGQAGARQLLHLDGPDGSVLFGPAWWVSLPGPALFLWATWSASDVLVRLDKGDAFGPAVIRGMNRMGAGLMLGAWCSILFQPMMLHLIGNGFLEARGVQLGYTIENLSLVLVGLALVLLARRGRALQANLDAFV